MTPLLSIQGIDKTFKNQYRALQNIELDVMPGEFLALLGPSGCGKTTLLTTIAGFLQPDKGRLIYDGADITEKPAHQRKLNTVFQSYALFPHMSILKNVMYGPERAGVKVGIAREQALEALALVGLEGFDSRMPSELSGGQRQRVALARAIVNKPKLLLLDEPLSALDLKLRKRMQIELKALQEKLAISFIFVTHDQEEALAMADRIVVMNQGRIEQIGTGHEIYSHPQSRFVGEFIGDANLLEISRAGSGSSLALTGQIVDVANDAEVMLVRPENVQLSQSSAHGLAGHVLDVINLGGQTTIYVQIGQSVLQANQQGGNIMALRRGDAVYVTLDLSKASALGA
ncbi:ABC transporter ATP-binding protein [Alcaligenes endophyticus]|uniref:ABC transporter ATP-binding protein n=1 Tax=Alcaligenes endophyticus TaxID=1929088 RepID=A0ABT8EJL8_9BURK|nr:ABC transporter ATP-binding protein [Alcaligenes endophyticus]MCX5591809.1 ABC transporter ATP-binding protein [Alcaligenes endophyticus]MDN4121486.1 ABC transporter ATP-binding protein [Alcaligenes endophyticus]